MDADQLLHQVNTSFCLLRWHVEALPDDACKKNKKLLFEEIEHVQSLIKECSGQSKPPDFQTINIADLCTEVFESFSEMSQCRSLSIDTGEKPIAVNTSLFYSKELIRILLENAIKHTPKGQPITLSCHKEKNSSYIAIENKGVGICPKQVESSERLGLSVAHLLAPKANARIEYESDNQHFTRFKIAYKPLKK